MTQAWANFVISGGANCNCCGGGTPACFLSLPPPIGDGGYANLTLAQTQINNYSDNCLVWANVDAGAGGFLTSLAASLPAGNTLFMNFNGLKQAALGDTGEVWAGCSVAVNTYLNVAYSDTADTHSTGFYYSNGVSAGSISGASNSILIPAADNIAMAFTFTRVFGSGSISSDINLFSPNAVSFCSIRANYDSGGGAYTWLNC